MAKIKGLKAEAENHPEYKVPQRIYKIETKAVKKKPEQIAKAFLKRLAPDLKIEADLSQLKFDKVKKTILGSHVLFQQYHNGKQISGAWVRVDIDKNGKVFNVQNDLIPSAVVSKANEVDKKKKGVDLSTKGKISAQKIITLALEEADDKGGKRSAVLKKELLYFPFNKQLVLAWKIIIETRTPERGIKGKSKPAEWKMYFDAVSGKLLEKQNIIKSATGKGKVFDPNPVVTLNNVSLKDNSTIPETAYLSVELTNLATTGYLDGPYGSTRTTKNRIQKKNLVFEFTRKDRAFKEVMVYFHIHRAQEYIQSLGFNNVLNHVVEVNVDGQTDDNSYYSPTNKDLTFGTGGVDDAEDAEIILHEYGHAIQDDQVPGFGATEEGGAMGEGFGDYLAASFFADVKPKEMRATVGNWDATAYSKEKPPCLRRLDTTKKYPANIANEVHADGEIWSACLWELRSALGRKVTDTLVLAHHFLLTRAATFKDGANALLTADRNLNEGRNNAVIKDVFVRRGILAKVKG